jgi:hypothetical protein
VLLISKGETWDRKKVTATRDGEASQKIEDEAAAHTASPIFHFPSESTFVIVSIAP